MADTIGAKAGKLNMVIEQGATFNVSMTWKDSSGNLITGLDSWTARMYMKVSKLDETPVLELTTENGRLFLGETAGSIRMYISALDTAAITDLAGVYDLELVSPTGAVTRLLAGKWKLDTEVTDE